MFAVINQIFVIIANIIIIIAAEGDDGELAEPLEI